MQEGNDTELTEVVNLNDAVRQASPDRDFLHLPIIEDSVSVSSQHPHGTLSRLTPSEEHDALIWMLNLPEKLDPCGGRLIDLPAPISASDATGATEALVDDAPSLIGFPELAKHSCSSNTTSVQPSDISPQVTPLIQRMTTPCYDQSASLSHLCATSYPIHPVADGSILPGLDDSHYCASPNSVWDLDGYNEPAMICAWEPSLDAPEEESLFLDIDDADTEIDQNKLDEEMLNHREVDLGPPLFDMDVDIYPRDADPDMTFAILTDSDGLEEFEDSNSDEDMPPVPISPRPPSSHVPSALAQHMIMDGRNAGSRLSPIVDWEDDELHMLEIDDDIMLLDL